jgi:hypothetical protein
MKNMKNIIDLTLDAITASGKKFSELPKDAMFMYLQRNGVSKQDINNIYDKIGNICNNTRDKIYSITPAEMSFEMATKILKNRIKGADSSESSVMSSIPVRQEPTNHYVSKEEADYNTDSNGVKKREPRKNLFSEVIKLT